MAEHRTKRRITAGGAGGSKIRGACAGLLLLLSAAASAQPWEIREGDRTLGALGATVQAPAPAALAVLAGEGYLYARVDSVRVPVVHVTAGPLVPFGRLRVVADSFPSERYRSVVAAQEGEPARAESIEATLGALTALARSEGFADARADAELEPGDSLAVTFRVREGPRLGLDRVVLRGARRATGEFALRASGLVAGQPVRGLDVERVRRDLEESGAFAQVGTPRLARDAEGRLVLDVQVEEGPPGVVDAVLGYLPPSAGRSGEMVGTARVDLASPFGGGRALALALDRSPGLASSFSAAASDPFVFGLPVRAALSFEGEGRDSTYNRQRVGAEAGVRVAPGLTLALTASREGVQPGQAGTRAGPDGLPRVRRSSAWFGGVALRYVAVDSRLAPTRGLVLATSAEQGVRSREALDSLALPTRVGQQRLDATARVYVPLAGRLVGVIGGDARLLLTDRGETTEATRYDEGELFRFGGATSLRGYDEDTFLGNAVGRALAELRAGLGGDTYAFAFGDLGAVRTPTLGETPGETRWLPGYGVGAQLETGLGLVAITYALNPDLPASRGKVHLRLQFGL